jgi:hypothetical protein
MGIGRTEQHAVGNDDSTTSAIIEKTQEEVEEENLGLFYFGRKGRIHVARIDCSFKWRIREHDVIPALFGKGFRERVHIMETRSGQAVQHEVHAANAEHCHPGIAIVASEGFVLRKFPLLWLELAAGESVRPPLVVVLEIAFVCVRLKKMLPGVDEKAACARRRIDDPLARLGVDHLDHHSDDVTRRSELTIRTCRVETTKQVLVQIALHVLILGGDLHLIDSFAGLDEEAWLTNLKLGGGHMLAEGTGLGAELL